MTTSLCLIVKNEIDYLPGCVASARGLADEVVIVDTGSDDGTVELARRLADIFVEIAFAEDFAAARNEALSRASGDWILFLDADERLPDADAGQLGTYLGQLDDHDLGVRLLRYNFFADGGFYTGRELKVFRNHRGLRYQRKINESVAPSITAAGGRIVDAPVLLNHFGHCRSVAQRDAKAARYLGLLDLQLRERPGDAVLLGYQALILRTLGRFDEAIEQSNRSIATDEERPVVWLFRGHVLRAVGQDVEAAEAYEHGLSFDAGSAALHNALGVQLVALADPDRARVEFQTARSCDPMLVHTDINLGLLAQAAENWPEAIALFERSGARNPGFFHDEFAGRVERDPFRPFYKETILGYAGLGYHLGYCLQRAAGRFPPSGR